MELVVVTNMPGLPESLQSFEGLQVSSLPSLARARSIVVSDQPPQALYVEDTRGTLNDLWEVIRAAQSKQIPVLVGLQSVGLMHMTDFMDAGLRVSDARDTSTLAGWIGEQLGIRRLAATAGQVTVAVAGAKGGIGKTLVVAMLAEGLKRRGLQVLVVDGDLSNSGLVPTFRIPSGFPSYLYLKSEGLGAFTPANVRRHIYQHQASGIHFLLGSEETANPLDLNLGEWQAMMQAVRALDGYDVILVDTYLSPLDVAPHSKFSRAVHHMVDALCAQTGLHAPLPMAKSSLWQQLRGEKIAGIALPAIGTAEVRA